MTKCSDKVVDKKKNRLICVAKSQTNGFLNLTSAF